MKTDISEGRLDMEQDVPGSVQHSEDDSQKRCMYEILQCRQIPIPVN